MNYFDFKELSLRFNLLSLRERGLAFIALIVFFSAVNYFWLIEPNLLRFNHEENKLSVLSHEKSEINTQISELESLLTEEQQQNIIKDINALEVSLRRLNKNEALSQLAEKKQITALLSQLLVQRKGVTFKSLKTLPVELLNINTDNNLVLYQHTLEIQLTGTNDSVYQYLNSLTLLEVPFFWKTLLYQVTASPLVNITLQLYVLTKEPELIHN